MRWSSAASTDPRLAVAVREAAAAVRRGLPGHAPDLCFAFVSAEHKDAWDELPGLVARELAPAALLGCSAGGVIGGGREYEQVAALSLTGAVLPGVEVRPFHLSEPELPAVPAGGPPQFVLLPDPFTFDVEELLRAIDTAHPDGTTVGGLASGGREPGENVLYAAGGVHRGGCAGVVLAGDVVVDTIVAQGCRPIGEPMFVTRAERNVIHTLDGRQAGLVLQELYRHASADDQELFRQSLFLGIVMQEHRQQYGLGDFLVRNVLGIDGRSGALVVGALVHEGMVVQFHLRDAKTSADDLDALLARYAGEARGALLFSCLGRGRSLYGRADHDTDAFRVRLGDVPLGGFFCNGEIGPVHAKTFLHGYTSAFGLVRPRR